MNEPITSSNSAEPIVSTTSQSRGSLFRLVFIVLCVLGAGSGGVYWWTFGEGEKWWRNAWRPAMAEFHGKVTLDGKPLRGGQLTTWPDQRGVPRSVGFIGQDGEFLLRTDIDGKFVEQAFVGRHRISVTQFAQQVGPSAPQLTSPAKYSSPDTSGLSVTIVRDQSQNHANMELVSDSPNADDRGPTAKPEASADDSPQSRVQ